MTEYKRVLTIAGSDSGGGAGVEADFKTVSALECYAMSAFTALTAQNTQGVHGIYPVLPEFTVKAIRAVLEDTPPHAIKIGMLGVAEMAEAVGEVLASLEDIPVIVDPVMIAKGGDALLEDHAIGALRKDILIHATLLTPNKPEAEELLGSRITTYDEMEKAARDLMSLGCENVVIKGGHFDDDKARDCLYLGEEDEIHWFEAPRIDSKNTHGTGCTFAAACAAFIARGESIHDAVAGAKDYVAAAIKAGAKMEHGKGHGPVHHFHNWWG